MFARILNLIMILLSAGSVMAEGQIHTASNMACAQLLTVQSLPQALNQIYNYPSAPLKLRLLIAPQLAAFHLPQPKGNQPEPFWALKTAISQLTSKSYLSRTLRKQLILASVQLLSQERAMQFLLPLARGLTIEEPHEIYFANTAIKILAAKYGLWPPRQKSSLSPKADDHTVLLQEPIADISALGGGWNSTFLVTFKNGRRAVFKPFLGQRNLGGDTSKWIERLAFTREVTATPLIEFYLKNKQSRENGLSRIIVPETVEVTLALAGKSYGLGSLQMLIENFESANTAAPLLQGTEGWRQFENRARTIDYVLGNPDRFSNPGLKETEYVTSNYDNVLVPKNLNSTNNFWAVMIDNACGRPGFKDFSLRFVPAPSEIPRDLQEAILSFPENEFRKEFQNQLPDMGLEDVVSRIHKLQGLITRWRATSGSSL